jgi:hypothetical protein
MSETVNTQEDQPHDLELVRDVLDKQLVDGSHDPLGRVDGIVLVVDDEAPNTPPRVESLESGITVAARRVNQTLAEWTRAIGRRIGLRGGEPVRFDWSAVKSVGIELTVDRAAQKPEALRWEEWLHTRVTRHLPSIKPEPKKSDD